MFGRVLDNMFLNEQTYYAYAKYYIRPCLTIYVGEYEQYQIHDVGYIEVAGTLELEEGAMVLIHRNN